MDTYTAAGCQSFTVSLAFWCINYVAMEIEMPYGDDSNDLPLILIQEDTNSKLTILLDGKAQKPPPFRYDPVEHCKFRRRGWRSTEDSLVPVDHWDHSHD